MAATSPPSSSSGPSDGHESSSKGDQASSSNHIQSTSGHPHDPNATWTFPRIFVFKHPPAWNSSQVDERCFTYCSQTSRRRAVNEDPWCRTICFRRVFGHEVHDGSYDASHDINGILKPDEPLPLPPEGQPAEATPDGYVEINDKTKYWKEGRYVWVSKSRWAAQEKLDSMSLSLPSQHSWMRYKESIEKQKLAEEVGHAQRNQTDSNASERQPAADDEDAELGPSIDSLRHSRNIAIRESFLFPITPIHTMIQDALQQKLSFLLGPTHKVLSVFSRSFTEGTQSRFLAKAYQQATNGSTLTLVRNVWSKHETWLKEFEERKELEDRKKKGGGSEVGEGGRDP